MKLREVFTNFAKKSGLIAVSTVIVVSTFAAGIVTFTQPSAANASCSPQDTYPQTNIIYCGLSGGSDPTALMQSFKGYYTSGHDTNGNTDLKTVYNDVTTSSVSNMFTTGHWSLGTSYNNGTIVADGYVVGTDVQIASRCYLPNMGNCQPPSKYKHLEGNVYTRDATWFFDKSVTSKPTLVHFNDDGVADLAMWTPCANALIFTAKPLPKVLECVSLDKEADSTIKYTFTAKAHEQYQPNGKMLIDFGDKTTSDIVKVNQTNVTFVTSHTYTQTDQDQKFTAQVAIGVNGLALAPNCKVTVHIPPKEKPPVKSLTCDSLTATPTDATNLTYNFTAKATASNTTISSYTFDFYGNGQVTQNFNTNQSVFTIPTPFTYDKTKPGTYIAKVTVAGPLGTSSTDACTAKIIIPTQPPLPNTGPGSVLGIFAATTTVGGLFHQFVLRRKLLS